MRYPHLLAAIALIAPAPLLAQALTPAETQKIDALVTKTLADTGVPSASVAVVRGGRIVLAKAYGKQYEGQTGPADPKLPYQIASVSK
ncbi:MAG TPA: serine hydrolase domain-containing protein, partial [Sphingomonas sanguinis]|nr:serine hydrolase domain-containing protein [Sphingomonas sanguinis]